MPKTEARSKCSRIDKILGSENSRPETFYNHDLVNNITNQVTVQQVQQYLLGLLETLHPGEWGQIVAGEQVIGRLVAESETIRQARKPGSAFSSLTILEEDGEHLEDFADHMP